MWWLWSDCGTVEGGWCKAVTELKILQLNMVIEWLKKLPPPAGNPKVCCKVKVGWVAE